MNNRELNQRIKLQDEINKNNEYNISATFDISSKKIQIPLHNLVKYSRVVQEEIKENEIFSKLNESIQKVNIKHQHSIHTFLQLLNDEEIDMKNDEFTDLLKLSEHFKVDLLNEVLKKYLQNHSNDIDFILNLKIEEENTKEKLTILNEDISFEIEECLKSNINECLENEKIKEISISTIYRMIEKSDRENLSNDLLCRFIIESIKERHALFHFINIEKLSDETYDEMNKYYEKYNKTTQYFDFLPNQLNYINKLRTTQKLQIKRIQELEKINENINKQKQQKEEEIDKIQKINQQQENQHKEELKQKKYEIEEIKKINEQNETRYKEEIKQKYENIDKIYKENIQLKEDLDQLKRKIQKQEQEKQQLKETINQLTTEINNNKNKTSSKTYPIIDHLTKLCGGNVHNKGVVNVTSSSTNSYHYAKNAVDINTNNNLFCSNDLPNSWLKYDFIKRKVHPTSYSITTVHDMDSHHPRNWVIEGSNNDNDKDWVILDIRQNDTSLSGKNVTRTFDIKTYEGSYRYLRIRQTSKNSSNNDILDFSSLEFIGTLFEDKQ